MIRVKFAVLSIFLMGASPLWSQDLREAVRTSNVERVKMLLESGADANTSYENRFTPIYFASSPQVVDLLLAHGAQLDIRDAASIQSPIERAAENVLRDKEHRVKWKVIAGKLRDAGAEYTIDTATYMNDVKFVREQLAADASWVNKTRGAQSVPLRLAARTGRVEICKLLLEHKAEPDSFEEGNGYPIIVDAVSHAAVVKLLIEYGANLKRRITWRGGRTGVWIVGDEGSALHYAVRDGNLESVKLLISAGLDPNAADDKGQTPLHVALLFERWDRDCDRDTSVYPKVIEYLLSNDASLRFTDRKGRTPAELAKQIGSPKRIRELLRKTQDERDAKYRKAMFGDE
jgi:ankyrin repeat protein